MKIKKLLQLPDGELPKNLVNSIPEKENRNKYYSMNNIFFEAKIDDSTNEDILIIDFFKTDGEHILRHFLDKNGKYLTKNKGKKSKASFKYIREYMLNCCNFNPISNKSILVIDDFLKNKKSQYSGIERLYHYSVDVMDKKLEERHQKIRDSINEEMLEVKPLPKKVENWVNKVLMSDSQYLFYDNNHRKMTTGYCTVCQNTFNFERPNLGKNSSGKCPFCKKQVKYISNQQFGRKNYYIKDENNFAWLQKTKQGLVVRRFYVIREHRNYSCKITTKTNIYENIRVFYENDRNSNYRYKQAYCMENDWKYQYDGGWYYLNIICCPVGLNALFKQKNTDFKCWHTNFELMVKKLKLINIDCLLTRNKINNPLLGHLVNLKLYNLAHDIINNRISVDEIDINKTNLPAALKIDKEHIKKMLIPLNPNMQKLEVLKYEIKRKDKSPISDYKKLFNLFSRPHILISETHSLLKHMSVHRCVDYISNQLENHKYHCNRFYVSNNSDFSYYLAQDYNDYMTWAEKLGYDLRSDSVRFPKNFTAAHDRLHEEYEEYEQKIENEKYRLIADQEEEYNSLYYYEDKKFLIRAPHDAEEICAEGKILHHCVSSYRMEIATKDTIILLIRKKEAPEVPYFTLNLNPNTLEIIQCRGNYNCAYPNDVENFMNQWYEEKVNKRITKRSRIGV